MSHTIITAEAMRFSELFVRGQFAVPWHQRDYDWKQDDVQSLLHDVDEALREDRTCYFLGTVMLVSQGTSVDPSGQWEINDGQQRMVTFSLLCAALCRRFAQEAKGSPREGLALRVLFDLEVNMVSHLDHAEDYAARLTPPKNDLMRYQQMIRGKPIGTNGTLTTAWNEIETFVSGMSHAKAEQYFDFLLQKIEVACLWVPASVDAHSVYETINGRGKPLDDLDLIRNYLYSHFNTDGEVARRGTVHERLEAVRTHLASSAKSSEYLRCFFQCQYGFLAKERWYRRTRDAIRSSLSTMDRGGPAADYVFHLVETLSSKHHVELFRTMTAPNPNSHLISTFQADSNTTNDRRHLGVFLRELRDYKVTHSLIFAMLTRYINESDRRKKKRMARIVHTNLRRLASFVLRTAFVAPKFEPSHFETEFSNFARQVVAATDVPDEPFAHFLHNCDKSASGVLQDATFRATMETSTMTGTRKIKLFLLGVNSVVQRDGDVFHEQRCTIEHVLPRSQEHWTGWHGFKNVNCADWIDRVGNLTLLGGSNDNKSEKAYNSSFSKKQRLFRNSAFEITRQLDTHRNWSPDDIETRQKEMAQHATEIWQF